MHDIAFEAVGGVADQEIARHPFPGPVFFMTGSAPGSFLRRTWMVTSAWGQVPAVPAGPGGTDAGSADGRGPSGENRPCKQGGCAGRFARGTCLKRI